jgi:hypothetical protein
MELRRFRPVEIPGTLPFRPRSGGEMPVSGVVESVVTMLAGKTLLVGVVWSSHARVVTANVPLALGVPGSINGLWATEGAERKSVWSSIE